MGALKSVGETRRVKIVYTCHSLGPVNTELERSMRVVVQRAVGVKHLAE